MRTKIEKLQKVLSVGDEKSLRDFAHAVINTPDKVTLNLRSLGAKNQGAHTGIELNGTTLVTFESCIRGDHNYNAYGILRDVLSIATEAPWTRKQVEQKIGFTNLR